MFLPVVPQCRFLKASSLEWLIVDDSLSYWGTLDWGFWFLKQSICQSTALVPVYLQFGEEPRWRCGHICTHVPIALKKEWARESTVKVKSGKHFRFQETTEKRVSVRSPGFEGSLCRSSRPWVCAHGGEGGPSILKSKKHWEILKGPGVPKVRGIPIQTLP